MDALLSFLLFIMVASVGAWGGITVYKDIQKADNKSQSIGTIVMYIDGQELVATCLELNKDILNRDNGELVYMKLEYRKHNEINNG